jgi:hypothetical protein
LDEKVELYYLPLDSLIADNADLNLWRILHYILSAQKYFNVTNILGMFRKVSGSTLMTLMDHPLPHGGVSLGQD